MSALTILQEKMKDRGILRAQEILALGIHVEQLRRWLANGEVELVSRGLYYLPGLDLGEFRSLIEVCTATPKAVICLLSALRYHGATTQNPSETWIALPKGQRSPRRRDLSLRVVHLAPELQGADIEVHRHEGGAISVYSLERTLVVCFRFRNAVGLDVFLEATREVIRTRRVSMDCIHTLAKHQGVESSIRPYLEAV